MIERGRARGVEELKIEGENLPKVMDVERKGGFRERGG